MFMCVLGCVCVCVLGCVHGCVRGFGCVHVCGCVCMCVDACAWVCGCVCMGTLFLFRDNRNPESQRLRKICGLILRIMKRNRISLMSVM